MKRFSIDHQQQILMVDGQNIPLPQKEFELFRYLLENPCRILSAKELYDEVWHTGKPNQTNSVAVHIARLRRRLPGWADQHSARGGVFIRVWNGGEDKTMKRFFLILFLILSLCDPLLFTASKSFVSDGPKAEEGVSDFENTDFTSSVCALDGWWELYYSRLYTPDDFKKGVPEGRELIELPGPWTKLGYPGLGYATYHLTVRTGSDRTFLLCIPEIMSSSVVWVNGEEVFRAGHVGTLADETVPGVRNDLLAAGDRGRCTGGDFADRDLSSVVCPMHRR